ncbi:MAG TPA: hypothetical protein VKS03_07900, partial [Thermoanaerobaculia bacterium]|nr:hypothetical protein [Thermoanaerobaculia bacterium]
DTTSERFRSALARVASEAERAGKVSGIMVGSREQIPALRALGYRFFTTSDRALLLEAGRSWRKALPLP